MGSSYDKDRCLYVVISNMKIIQEWTHTRDITAEEIAYMYNMAKTKLNLKSGDQCRVARMAFVDFDYDKYERLSK